MKLLVFQHIDCEHPGQLRHFLAADGVDVTTVELDAGHTIPALEPFDALWVMGGPMDVWDVEANPWLIAEKQAIATWVRDLGRPYLGLCLGHQLLADALGGTCGPMSPPEIGVLDVELTAAGQDDAIFAGMPTTQPALQWHSVQVSQPPLGAVVLATSPACAVQAMRVGDVAWSMQYHVEVEPDTVRTWAEVPEYKAALHATVGADALPRLIEAADQQLDTFLANSQQLYTNFVEAVARHRVAHPRNEIGQPVGVPLAETTLHAPARTAMHGRFCEVVPLDANAHGAELFEAFAAATDDGDWTYLSYGPFATEQDFVAWLGPMAGLADPMFFTIIDRATGHACGLASYLRVDPRARSVEVGHIHFARALQQTPAATEAMHLMMERAFNAGYRRYEWKCDDLNGPSRAAATRLGFVYEGTFRKATHYKGRSRDTAWFAIVDVDWPAIDHEFQRWLNPANFDAQGAQQSSLATRMS